MQGYRIMGSAFILENVSRLELHGTEDDQPTSGAPLYQIDTAQQFPSTLQMVQPA